MSRFFSKTHDNLTPYTPGEQPRDRKYIKLNTNESPFPPSPKAVEAIRDRAASLNLYSDPTALSLKRAIAERYGVDEDMVTVSNGSDEILAFCFMAFCDGKTPMAYFDVTYGFYKVYAELFNIKSEVVALKEDFTADFDGLKKTQGNVIIANPNAQTGIFESLEDIESLVRAKADRVVIVDEAYCDFGGKSCIELVKKYDNLILVSTFSKSRNLAGGRIGYAIANGKIVCDLETVKFSFNPYNLGTLPIAAGVEAMKDVAYFEQCTKKVVEAREYTKKELISLGFEVLNSSANFLLARTDKMQGKNLYLALKAKGILVRYLGDERIKDFIRITIGSAQEMQAFIAAVKEIL